MMTEEPVVVAEVAAPAIEAAATVVVNKEPAVDAKSQKTSKKRNPPYFEMIKEAISSLKDKTGSSQYAIAKFVQQKQNNLPEKFKKVLLIQLKRLVAQGKLIKVKASYKLPAAAAPAKKRHVAKPKSAVKKTVVEKPAAKPKATPNAKAVAKPKAAAKPKPVARLVDKAKPKPPTKPAKVGRTSTRSTLGKKPTSTQKQYKVTRRSTLRKKASMIAKPPTKNMASNSVKTKATRKTKK